MMMMFACLLGRMRCSEEARERGSCALAVACESDGGPAYARKSKGFTRGSLGNPSTMRQTCICSSSAPSRGQTECVCACTTFVLFELPLRSRSVAGSS